jgi:hypothetical protein
VDVTGIHGSCVAEVGQTVGFTADANDKSKVQWTASRGNPNSGPPGPTFSTSFSTSNRYEVEASCNASSMKTKIAVLNACRPLDLKAIIQDDLKGNQVPLPGSYGFTRTEITETAFRYCVEGGQFCGKLSLVKQEILTGVATTVVRNGMPLISLGGGDDPKITAANCAEVIADLTPLPLGSTSGPPREKYWIPTIVGPHEMFHRMDFRMRVTEPAVTQIAGDPAACSQCEPGTLPNEVLTKKLYAIYDNLEAIYGQGKVDEIRAYDLDQSKYLIEIDKIRQRFPGC